MSDSWWVRPVNGDDSNSGASFADARKTTLGVLPLVSPGDTVYLCAEASEFPVGTIQARWNSAVRGVGECTTFIGANASGVVDGTQYVLDGTNHANDVFQVASATFSGATFRFQNMRFTNGGRFGFYAFYTSSSGQIYCQNCRFDNNASFGFGSAKTPWYSDIIKCYLCEFDHNVTDGLATVSLTAGYGQFFANYCSFHHNGRYGVWDLAYRGGQFYNCLFYRNGTAIRMSSKIGCKLQNCTVAFNSGGIYDGSTYSPTVLYNSIFAYNTTNVFDTLRREGLTDVFENNCIHTDGGEEILRNSLNDITKGGGIIREDPDFISTVDESEDFTPQNTNLLIKSVFQAGGTSNKYIGAIKPNPY